MFHWEPDFPPPLWTLPEPAVSYLICRHAIAALCSAQPRRPVLWVPTFFCPEVARFCRPAAQVREYRDDCRRPAPEWGSLQPGPDDLVLAVNYFGVRSPEPWREWRNRNPCLLVEDHTQDPFSKWALESNADYAVCSLRKTLPVPDGAILWSPAKRPLPARPTEMDTRGSMMKLGAMVYKRNYLEGTVPAECKARYRELQLEGEQRLSEAGVSAISPISEAILARGVPKRWRERRIENACTLLQSLQGWKMAAPVFTKWPEGHAPFDLPLVFREQAARDDCQRALQQENVFCPVEWVSDTPDADASDLSSRILSVPVDHRYTRDDMARVSAALWKVCD
ncbi:MAG TPA: hypothetical protein VE377_25265 [Candidatus Dormibacteraeota bacterium]|nr:hypothetical protein [Candidatus Dormibacteraeota bacterium]